MMNENFQTGDMVFSTTEIYSDGTVPGTTEGELIAHKNHKGVLVNIGYLEDNPEVELFLVRFEHELGLGPAVVCGIEEIRHIVEAPQSLN
jgi:nitrogen fixation protein NifZ